MKRRAIKTEFFDMIFDEWNVLEQQQQTKIKRNKKVTKI